MGATQTQFFAGCPDPGWRVKAGYNRLTGPKFRSGTIFYGVGSAGNEVQNTVPQGNLFLWNKLISEHAKRGQGRQALRIYKRMRETGIILETKTFVAALKACSSIADLEAGKEIHAHVINRGVQTDIFVANTLVDMYAKCGSIVDARIVFENMLHRDVVSWNAMIMGYAQMEEGRLALQIYVRMQREGFTPSARTFVATLKACASLAAREQGKQVDGEVVKVESLQEGRTIHSQVAKSGLERDIFVANTLVDMYAKCGSVVDARRVFEKMPHRDVVSWTAMIMGYAQTEKGESALQLYERMQREGFTPNSHTFVAALKACGSLEVQEEGTQVDGELVKIGCLEKVRAIHSQVAKSVFEADKFVANTLVDMYAKCGSMVNAGRVFEKMPHRDVVSWTAMIMGYAQMEKGELALQFFARMQDEGFTPNARTFVAALKACSGLAVQEESKLVDGELVKIGSLEKGRFIHSQVATSGFEMDIFVANTLIDMYAKCGSMLDACDIFEKMQHRDVVSWTAMIMGYSQMEKGEMALQLYDRMQHEGCTPNARTFVAALKACDSLAAQEEGREVDSKLVKTQCLEKVKAIHSQVARSIFERDIFVGNTLVDLYAKCGSMVDAGRVFEQMPRRDSVSWTTMIMGYTQVEKAELALQLFARMQHEHFKPDALTFVAALKACGSLARQEEGKQVDAFVIAGCLEKGRAIHSQVAKNGFESDIFVANSLIDMYAKCGNMVDAHKVFDNMICRDLVSWNAMIVGYAQREEGGLALQLYARMQREGFTPDAYTFVAVLMACSNLASLETGKEIHNAICRVGLQGEMFVVNSLIDMYSKCGSMIDAQRLFDTSPVRDVVTWTTLLAGYSGQGDSETVFELFDRMQQEGVQPVGITFVSVLSVCSHTGLVEKGQRYFQVMCLYYGIIPARGHYSCMVDLLGRAGGVDEAVAMVKKMPFKPYVVTWMTILGACRMWNNVEVGRHAFDCVVRLDGKQAAAYVLMTNIYASAHIFEESVKIEEMKTNARALKNPGQCWWTDNTGIVHTFSSGDKDHPQSKDIYAKVQDLFVKIKEEGYAPDFDSGSHSITYDGKEDILCGHSEMLAIACALINTPQGTTIRFVKNLHVCGACHITTTLISMIEQRVIICRDASRFHVHKDGKCSCGKFC